MSVRRYQRLHHIPALMELVLVVCGHLLVPLLPLPHFTSMRRRLFRRVAD